METTWRAGAVLVFLAAAAVFLDRKLNTAPVGRPRGTAGSVTSAAANTVPGTPVEAPQDLPRLLDFGGGTCPECQMMQLVLAALRKDYAGRFLVEYCDIKADPNTVAQYGVWGVPTQIFLDPSGREVFRHFGYFSPDDILAKWNELGIRLTRNPCVN
jgi:thioredoxin 1